MTSERQTGEPTKGGDERDAFSGFRKRYLHRRAGDMKGPKRSYNKRVRRQPVEEDKEGV